MNKFTERRLESHLGFRKLDEQFNNHGLETKETRRLREEIQKFLETYKLSILQELGTKNFSVMVGGSLQAGTADEHSDVDLTIILDRGNTGEIWTKGGACETSEGVRGIFLFRKDSLKKQLQKDVGINLLSLESILSELENLEPSQTEEDKHFVISSIVQIFSPQLYEAINIDDFRKSIIKKLSSMTIGEKIWNQAIVPQIKATLAERNGDEKGGDWPERQQRSLAESLQKNTLSKSIADRLSNKRIPNFQEIRMEYGL